MYKDFDKWNEVKKKVNEMSDNFGVHEREIWWVSLGVNIGVETNGKHDSFERPVLVLKKFNRQMVWCMPTTSREKDPRFYKKFSLNGRVYFAIVTQLRTVSTKRFIRKIGMMSEETFETIRQDCTRFLQKDENPHEAGFLGGRSHNP